jgi:hypothetical protein
MPQHFRLYPLDGADGENPGFAALFGVLKSGDFMKKYALFEE